jgi:DNA-binding LacI/PurR family transcriptional regulator
MIGMPTSNRDKTPAVTPARRVNASDVAAAAAVSRSAVSRTFTPGASVAPQTRARVIAAAEALGYSPNLLARSLVTKKAGLVAVVMANLNSPFFSEFATRLNLGLRQQGFRMLLLIVPPNGDADSALTEAFDYHIDGAILLSAMPSPALMETASQRAIPLVVLDRREAGPGAALVWTDGLSVGLRLAELMLAEGRRRPALVVASLVHRTREFTSFADHMERSGSAPCRWIACGLDYEQAVKAADQLFGGDEARPDAIFAATDILAIGVLDSARLNYRIKVPEDVSIIGVGDTPQASWRSHAISTVRVPIAALVQTAISTMVASIESPGESAPRIWLECDVVERGTTRGGLPC